MLLEPVRERPGRYAPGRAADGRDGQRPVGGGVRPGAPRGEPGEVRNARGGRYRGGHSAGRVAARVRAVLHHQTARKGNGSGTGHRPRDCRAVRGERRGVHRGRGGDHVQGVPAAARRMASPGPVRVGPGPPAAGDGDGGSWRRTTTRSGAAGRGTCKRGAGYTVLEAGCAERKPSARPERTAPRSTCW